MGSRQVISYLNRSGQVMLDQGQFSSVQVRSKADQVKIRSSRVRLDQDGTNQVRSV